MIFNIACYISFIRGKLCSANYAGKKSLGSLNALSLRGLSSKRVLHAEVLVQKFVGLKRSTVPQVKLRLTPARGIETYIEQMEGELDPDFSEIVKNARKRAGITQEQLASQIMEKALVIKKIERKELTPDDKLRKKLEKALNVESSHRNRARKSTKG